MNTEVGTESSAKERQYLRGGGEMGELMRRHDWSNNPVGPINTWPVSLRAQVNLMLASRFPMLIFWGKELITFYNDAFRPSLGNEGKHPSSLGQRGEQSWAESWPTIGPLIYTIMAGGEAVWFEDQKLPIYREGGMGYAYWTYSFSPITNDEGEVNGILVTCMETTANVEALQKVEQSEHRFRNLVEKGLSPICILKGEDMVLELGNEPLLHVWQTDRSAIGKPLLDILPEMADQPIMGWLLDVYRKGITLNLKEVPARFERKNGKVDICYFNFVYQPYREIDGTITGVMALATDITDHVLSRQRLEESRSRLLSLFEQSPVGVAVLDKKDLTFRMANAFYGQLVDREPNTILDKPLLEALPEIAGQGFDKLLEQVIATSVPYIAPEVPVEIKRGEGLERIYVNLAYQPMLEHDASVSGVLVVATDITPFVNSRRQVEESETKFRSLIEEAPVATCLFVGPEMRVEVINEMMVEAWGKDFSVLNQPLIKALPELEGQPFMDILANVYATGEAYRGIAAPVELVIDGRRDTYYYDFTYKPILNESGKVWAIINVSINVTDRVLAMRQLEQSEARFRSLIEEAPVATCLFVGRSLNVEVANDIMIDLWGKDHAVIGKPLEEAVPELKGQPFLDILDRIFDTGEAYSATEAEAQLEVGGVLGTYYFNFTYKPLFDANGKVYAIIDMAIDVTQNVLAKKAAEEANAILSGAIELAELGTWSVSAVTGLVTFSDRIKSWFGFDGELQIDAAFNSIHPDDRPRIEKAIINGLTAERNGGFDEEYRIVNLKDGKERIIHAYAKTFYTEDGRPLELRGSARNITQEKNTQLALEEEVDMRTEQLRLVVNDLEESNKQLLRSNEELAQYAYVASHDLQEPLRKIILFSNQLNEREHEAEKRKDLVGKIRRSTERMSMLIHDLLEFSRLLKSDALLRPVNLKAIVEDVTGDFELLIADKGAEVQIGALPIIEGVALQMNQLFNNLVGNALKFSRRDRQPFIGISSRIATEKEIAAHIDKGIEGITYHLITVEDNGIGFEPVYLDQIFEVFKRLHGRHEYSGSGIGLAICRRVAENHKGAIYADAEVDKGARFHILLPERQSEAPQKDFAWNQP